MSGEASKTSLGKRISQASCIGLRLQNSTRGCSKARRRRLIPRQGDSLAGITGSWRFRSNRVAASG